MKPITIQQPQRIVFGSGCIAQFCEDYLKMGYKRLFILTAPPILPLIDGMLQTLHEAGVETRIYDRIMQEPSVTDFKNILAVAKEFCADSVIGVGGGSVLDICKLVAALIDSEQQVEDLFGIGFVARKGCWFACMPTTAGTGSVT